MISFANENNQIFPNNITKITKPNQGVNINIVKRDIIKKLKSYQISNKVTFIYVSAIDRSVENLLIILPDGFVSKKATGDLFN